MKDLSIVPPIGKLLNREHIEIGKGLVKHSYFIDKKFVNRNNQITGGILATTLDMLCGHALHTMHKKKHANIELKTFFLSPALPGKFIGEGNVIKVGRSVGFAESVLRDDKEQEIARASATFRIFNQ